MDTPKPKPDQKVVIESSDPDLFKPKTVNDPNAKIVDTRDPADVQYTDYIAALSDLPLIPGILAGQIDLMAVASRARRISLSNPYRISSIYRAKPEQDEVIVKPGHGAKDDQA